MQAAAQSAAAADLHLLIQFLVDRTSYRAAFVALHIGRQIARPGLPMADRRLVARVGGGWRRIGPAGRGRISRGVCRVLGERHAQDNRAKHRRPYDGRRSETTHNVICESWSHLRLLDWERRFWMARAIDERSTGIAFNVRVLLQPVRTASPRLRPLPGWRDARPIGSSPCRWNNDRGSACVPKHRCLDDKWAAAS